MALVKNAVRTVMEVGMKLYVVKFAMEKDIALKKIIVENMFR